MATLAELEAIVSEMEAIMAEGLLYNPKMSAAIAKLSQWNKDRSAIISEIAEIELWLDDMERLPTMCMNSVLDVAKAKVARRDELRDKL